VFGNAKNPSSTNLYGWQSYANFAASFPDGTSNTILFAEKYATGSMAIRASKPYGPLWANNDNPGDVWTPAFAVTYDNGQTYAQYCASPCMFQVKPTPYDTAANVNVASTPHDVINVLFGDGAVRGLGAGIDPAGVWWPLLTPAGGDVPGPF